MAGKGGDTQLPVHRVGDVWSPDPACLRTRCGGEYLGTKGTGVWD